MDQGTLENVEGVTHHSRVKPYSQEAELRRVRMTFIRTLLVHARMIRHDHHLCRAVQVARLEQPVRLRALSEHPAWQGSDVWDADRMLIPVSMEQWDVVIDMSADMKCTPLHVQT